MKTPIEELAETVEFLRFNTNRGNVAPPALFWAEKALSLGKALDACTNDNAERVAIDTNHRKPEHAAWYAAVREGRNALIKASL